MGMLPLLPSLALSLFLKYEKDVEECGLLCLLSLFNIDLKLWANILASHIVGPTSFIIQVRPD